MAYNVSFHTSGSTGGGPRVNFGTDSEVNGYMEIGAYDNINNIDTKNRVLKIHSTGSQQIDVRMVNLPDASTAPQGAYLETIVVDKGTGKLYIRSNETRTGIEGEGSGDFI